MTTESERMLLILLIAAAVIVVLYLLFGRGYEEPTHEERERAGRAWAGRLEIAITGVECDPTGLCTFARRDGAPFSARCDATACSLQECR